MTVSSENYMLFMDKPASRWGENSMKSVEVIVWGLARMSSLMARILDEREGVGVVGAVDSAPSKTGRTLGELFRTVKIRNVTVAGNARHAPAGGGDMMLLAISSFICDAVTPMQMIMESGKDVIIIEWAWPRVRDPEAARRADSPVKEGRVSVLDTGVNPGFVPDTIIIALTGFCRGVRSMAARRVNDLSPYGPAVTAIRGVGKSPEDSRLGRENGSIKGHVDFARSVAMIASSTGLKIERVTECVEPSSPWSSARPLLQISPPAILPAASTAPGAGTAARQSSSSNTGR